MGRIAAVFLTATLALAGSCARGPETAPMTTASAPTAAAGAWAAGADDGMGWFFLADGGPRLAYGPPNSAASLMITCQGDGAMLMSTTTSAARTADLVLSSGSARATLPVTSEPDPVSGGHTMSARTRTSDAVMDSFHRTGQLTGAAPLHAGQEDRAAVEQFFAACG